MDTFEAAFFIGVLLFIATLLLMFLYLVWWPLPIVTLLITGALIALVWLRT